MLRPKSRARPSTAKSSISTSDATTSAPSSSGTTVYPVPATLADGLPLPKIIVFDLDYTLWACWCDTHVSPPLKAVDSGRAVRDQYGECFGFYAEVPGVLSALRQKHVKIGAASRTYAPDVARDMLRLLRIPHFTEHQHPAANSSATNTSTTTVLAASASSLSSNSSKASDFFDYLQIFPGSKITHFERLHEATGIPYEEMLFFDDESRNRDVEVLGVIMCLVRDGVSVGEVDRGVASWRKRNGRGKS